MKPANTRPTQPQASKPCQRTLSRLQSHAWKDLLSPRRTEFFPNLVEAMLRQYVHVQRHSGTGPGTGLCMQPGEAAAWGPPPGSGRPRSARSKATGRACDEPWWFSGAGMRLGKLPTEPGTWGPSLQPPSSASASPEGSTPPPPPLPTPPPCSQVPPLSVLLPVPHLSLDRG